MRLVVSLTSCLLISLASTTAALADIDRSGTFECSCSGDRCLDEAPFNVGYDRDRQWLTVDGANWVYSGVVSRQESKATGTVYLTLPSGYSLSSIPLTLELSADGGIKLHGSRLHCKRL